MKTILVYPCGTEIGLEIYRALCYSPHYRLVGGSSSYDHGRFVYRDHMDDLPFIHDLSGEDDVLKFDRKIADHGIDFIYPAMDGVLTVFSKYRSKLHAEVIAPEIHTAEITRSKMATYRLFAGKLPIPALYSSREEIAHFPVFVKPDVGQGSVGAKKISKNVCMEYLPGQEYTVDCLTNDAGALVYVRGRKRNRIKNGICVNGVFADRPEFISYARIINRELKQLGGWFFQVREACDGTLKLLEISARIAGTSAITRCTGVNLPLLTVNLYNGIKVDDVMPNDYRIELDRAFENRYRLDMDYSFVYVDYDDTLITDKAVNTRLVQFLYQCLNQNKQLILISRHDGDLHAELKEYRLKEIFDRIIHLGKSESKADYIMEADAIFVDDSYGERKDVNKKTGIPVFDTHMLECLIED